MSSEKEAAGVIHDQRFMNVIPFTAFIEAAALEDSSTTEQQQQVAAA
ncbi:hypothetical protein [Steroidobacter agaridevorans]|nr:hypothetical protein [Steroidobacter agaridevorans]